MTPPVLLLPGWHNSGPAHWQSRWEASHGYLRVAQHNWVQPLRGDWMMQLEEAVLAHPGAVLVAHSLGCHLVAAWSAHSQNNHRVKAALLVAPADMERTDALQQLHSWQPMVRTRLPFVSTVAVSRDDPYCSFLRASALAHDWGAQLVDCGPCGHLNAESGLGDWPQGHALLQALLKDNLNTQKAIHDGH